MFTEFCCSVVVSLMCYLCVVVYMEVILSSTLLGNASLDDPQWP